MLRLHHITLLALPLLALTTACSSSVTAGEPEPTAPRVTEVPGLDSSSTGDGANTILAPTGDAQSQSGVSQRTTAGHIWAEPVVSGDTVTIPRTVARMGDHVHFELVEQGTPLSFVGYFVGPAFLVRPCICPTCGDEAVDFLSGALDCQSCLVTYDAVMGTASEGGVCYPSGLIPNRIAGDTVFFSRNDLLVAYARVVAGEGATQATDGVSDSVPSCCPNH